MKSPNMQHSSGTLPSNHLIQEGNGCNTTDEGLFPPDWEKRRDCSPLAKLSLMGLPTEIRLKVLRECLSSKETFKGGFLEKSGLVSPKSPGIFFNPAILQVNRQLYEEGVPILYDNVMGMECVVLEDEDVMGRFCTAMFFNKRFHLCESKQTIPEYLRLHTRKVEINIIATNCTTEPTFLNELVSKVVVALSDNPQWSTLTIKFTVDGNITQETREVMEAACHTFQYLRGLKNVTFHGISESRATDLIARMKSNDPVINLATMYHALLWYVHSLEDAHYLDTIGEGEVADLLYETWRARDNDDAEAFHKARVEIMRRIDDVDEIRRAKVFEADPPAQVLQ
jgi:hypothetical protein